MNVVNVGEATVLVIVRGKGHSCHDVTELDAALALLPGGAAVELALDSGGLPQALAALEIRRRLVDRRGRVLPVAAACAATAAADTPEAADWRLDQASRRQLVAYHWTGKVGRHVETGLRAWEYERADGSGARRWLREDGRVVQE